jgi:predicted PurR-regulated permease PerM
MSLDDKPTRRPGINLQEIFFFIILAGVSIGFFSIIQPFLTDIFLAIILAIIFKRPLAYFTKVFKGKKGKATAVTLVLVIFTIVIPVTFIAVMISKEVGSTYRSFQDNWPALKQFIEDLPEKASSVPGLKNVVDDIDWDKVANQAEEKLSMVVEFLIGLIQQTFINVGVILIHFFIVLFLLYYLFIDGKKLVERIQYLVPLKDTEEREMFSKLEKVTDAIVLNTFMLGFIEGAFGGTLFAILGVPSPFFWGMLMTFLSIIPLVGANTILAPMGIIQILIGNVSTGVIILAVGCGAIIINQNIIRPRLDGHKSGMHPAIMFMASMGGLILMGLIGFIIGPMITGLFLVAWNQFGERYKRKLEEYNRG